MRPARLQALNRRTGALTVHDAHFARVTPIVGRSLRRMRVALLGLPVAAPLVTHLAACGVGRWLWGDPGDGSPDELRAQLVAQHGSSLARRARVLPRDEWATAVRCDPPNLIIAVGEAVDRRLARDTAVAASVPALLVALSCAPYVCQAIGVFPGDDLPRVAGPLHPRTPVPSLSPWHWATAAPLCAGLARAMLLRDTPFRRVDLEELWRDGARVLTVGGNADPFKVHWSAPGESLPHPPAPGGRAPFFHTPLARRGTLLIAGLGSLGSVAALHLLPHAARMVIADPDRVDACNPVRQAYPLVAVGQPKARTLREGLLAAGVENVVALDAALTDEQGVIECIERHAVTAALVVTGTAADFAIARALRACDVPHVVGRCYPRARYWEAILVDGQRGPALSDLRAHLPLGPLPAPTPEQQAAYSDAGALEAEPATLVESGWAAAWMARFVAQLLAPLGLRERWLLDLLAAQRTCIIGGVGVERTAEGPAYGVALPGAIRAWGRSGIR